MSYLSSHKFTNLFLRSSLVPVRTSTSLIKWTPLSRQIFTEFKIEPFHATAEWRCPISSTTVGTSQNLSTILAPPPAAAWYTTAGVA